MIFGFCVLLAAIPCVSDMRGPFPIMSTPYFKDGAVDCEGLKRELRFVSDSGCPGVIWGQSNDAIDLLTRDEKRLCFEACAAAADGLGITLALGANGTNTAELLDVAADIERIADRHPGSKIAMISRPPDNARTEREVESAWEALASVARRPVIFQTFGTPDTPTPSVELLVRFAEHIRLHQGRSGRIRCGRAHVRGEHPPSGHKDVDGWMGRLADAHADAAVRM